MLQSPKLLSSNIMTQNATSKKLDILVSNVMVHSMILALWRQKLKTHQFEYSMELP